MIDTIDTKQNITIRYDTETQCLTNSQCKTKKYWPLC